MKIFLDSSVVIAACGCATGASRAIFEMSEECGWTLQSSSYVLREVEGNLSRLVEAASVDWNSLRDRLQIVPDIYSFHWLTVFAPAKDRPILFTAAAWSDVLLTLDRADFGQLLGAQFYGLPILRPGEFLEGERSAGRLK